MGWPSPFRAHDDGGHHDNTGSSYNNNRGYTYWWALVDSGGCVSCVGRAGYRHGGVDQDYTVITHIPNNKVYGANMGPTGGRKDLGGPHDGSMNLAIWDVYSFQHDMETLLTLLNLCEGHPHSLPAHRWIPSQSPMTRSVDVSYYVSWSVDTRIASDFKTPLRSCEIPVMIYPYSYILHYQIHFIQFPWEWISPNHENIMIWIRFPHYWPFLESIHKWAVMRRFDWDYVITLQASAPLCRAETPTCYQRQHR